MTESNGIAEVVDFYTNTVDKNSGKSLFQTWEDSGAVSDSVTPSTSSKIYRDKILGEINKLSTPRDTIASLGCGNGFVEASLIKQGYNVKAIDLMAEAVSFARAKGVDAEVINFYDLPDDYFDDVGLVYADGFIGHLYSEVDGLDAFLKKLVSSGLKKGSYVFISNDSTGSDDIGVMRHETVKGFWYFSGRHLEKVFSDFGFEGGEYFYFTYERPVSGERDRLVSINRY